MKQGVLVLANKHAGKEWRFFRVYRKIINRLKKEKIAYKKYSKIEDIPVKELQYNAERLIILGGDGTLNYAVNYLYSLNIKIPLGVIPVGSANIFAQTIGVPMNINKSIKAAVLGEPVTMPVGMVNKHRIFLVATTTGVHSDLMSYTPRLFKRLIGQIAYYFRLPLLLIRVKRHEYSLEFSPKEKIQVKASAIFIINGLPKIYRGVFKRINSFEPKLYTLVVESARPAEVVRTFNAMYIQRKNPVKGVRYIESSSVLLETEKAPISIDGEKIEEKKIKAEINKDFFQFILPKGNNKKLP